MDQDGPAAPERARQGPHGCRRKTGNCMTRSFLAAQRRRPPYRINALTVPFDPGCGALAS